MRFSRSVALRDLDALKAVVSDHPAPDGVVEVQNQGLPALAAHRCNGASNVVGVERQEVVGEGKLRHVPQLGVMPIGKTDRLGEAGHIQQNIARGGDKPGQFKVDRIDDTSNRSRQSAIEAAEEHARPEAQRSERCKPRSIQS